MKRIKKSFQALGTINSITVTYDEAIEYSVINCLETIKAKVIKLNDTLSVFKETSEISHINAAAGKVFVPISKDTGYIIAKALEYSSITDGAFDITTRPLSKLWGIGKKGEYIPSGSELSEAARLVNYQDILVENYPLRVKLRNPDQEIDLGSIAKGYAADEARRILVEGGISDAVINFGGTVIVLGDEKKVGIQHPEKETGISMGILKVKDKAVVTSGWYEHYFIKNNKRYHHILNPRTGIPADAGISSITLVGSSAIELDALTTAVFVLGIDAGWRLLEQYQLEGIFVTKENDVFITKGLESKFEFIKEASKNNQCII